VKLLVGLLAPMAVAHAQLQADAWQGAALRWSGEARWVARQQQGANLGLPAGAQARVDDLAQRLQLRVDGQLRPGLAATAEVGTYAIAGAAAPVPASQRNRLDLAQAYLDAKLDLTATATATANGPAPATLRVGRQELVFGSSRMTSVRDGANLRQAFDGLRLTLQPAPSWRVDAFTARPVQARPGRFDDSSHGAAAFSGVYASFKAPDGTPARAAGLDLYLLSHSRSRRQPGLAAVPIRRHTLGARSFGRYDGWDWDIEAGVQGGHGGGQRVAAYSWANDLGFTTPGLPGSPRWGLKIDIASGDPQPGDASTPSKCLSPSCLTLARSARPGPPTSSTSTPRSVSYRLRAGGSLRSVLGSGNTASPTPTTCLVRCR
jgi:Alginate export